MNDTYFSESHFDLERAGGQRQRISFQEILRRGDTPARFYFGSGRLVFDVMAALRRLKVLLVGGRLPFVANANVERGEKMR